MTTDLVLENKVVLAAVQALLGTITPVVQAASVDVDGEARHARLHVALTSPDSITLALLEDVVFDLGVLAEDAVTVELRTWVGEDWTTGWEGADRRLLYAAYRH